MTKLLFLLKWQGKAACLYLIALAVMALAIGTALGQIADGMALSRFRIRETDDAGRPTWELKGEEANVGEIMVTMKNVDLILFQPDKPEFRVTSPACVFNRATGIVSSQETVHAETEGFTVDGRGYRILTNKQRLVIENDVRMVIDNAGSAINMPSTEINHKNEEKIK